ncbi:MAG: thioredoxin domain-containing protein [Silicimonas sp.]|nr:thioredoxin domain-containing protein [Silicimonas sp.]
MKQRKTNRRDLLALGAGLAAVAGGWQFWLRRPKPLSFAPIETLPGWRRLAFDGITSASGSATGAVFLGIGETETLPPLSADALCKTLYPAQGKGIPTAIFTDVNCPNCASLEAKLKARSDALSLNWHDLPLLGPASEHAARAMAAGDLQPNGPTFRQVILSTAPGRLRSALLKKLAAENGLDGDRLLKDMQAPEVKAKLRTDRRAAQTLGVWGTPGLTIGRTFVLGDLSADTLDQLIEAEASAKHC